MSASEKLVEIATARYRLGCSDEGEPFATSDEYPSVALPLRGQRSLRAELAADYHRNEGKVPPQAALTDCLLVLEGIALASPRETLWVRIARGPSAGVLVDLGDESGRAVEVCPTGWTVIDRPAVKFRRSALTGLLPVPERGGSVELLARFLNLSDEDTHLAVGWLVAALMPEIAHPIVGLFGEQGTGKSVMARFLGRLVDPSPADLSSAPRNEEQWAVRCGGSWVVCLDNLSRIPPWLSDVLCRAVTGDSFARRQLYSDRDVTVLAFKRVLVLTGIDVGAVQGDLAERMLRFEVRRIAGAERRGERELLRAFAETRPLLLGALLDELVAVLAVLPEIDPPELPRMADFAQVLAALDHVHGWSTARRYSEIGEAIEQDLLEDDPVGAAILALVRRDGEWSGTASDLLGCIAPAVPPRGFPDSAQKLGGHLTRLTPALRSRGVDVNRDRDSTERRITITGPPNREVPM